MSTAERQSPRDLVPRMRELRAEGCSAAVIGRRLGIPESTVRNWWNAGSCVDCGAATQRSGKKASDRCSTCAAIEFARRSVASTYWTRERIIEAVCWWAAEYGAPPTTTDWNPYEAIVAVNDLQRSRRAERLIAERRIPWFNTVYKRFGSWNAAIKAAGYTPCEVGGGNGNQLRRRDSIRKPSAETLEAVSPTEGMRPSVA